VSDEDLQQLRQPGQAASAAASATAPRRKVLFTLGGLTLLGSGGLAFGISASTHSANDPKTMAAAALPTARRSVAPSPRAHATASAAESKPADESATETVATRPQYYVDNDGPRAIALTMDDGPHPIYTPQVLEVLRKYDIKATFNMIGSQVGANLSLVREVSAEGHTITNHTWNHADLTHATYAAVCSQIDRCNEALAAANQYPTIFRAPYGNWATAVFQACAARELRPVDWSVDPRDWDTQDVDTQDIVRTVLRTTQPHDIILEHDGGGVRRNTVAALKIFIPKLLDEGYNFVAM
jgi:peptidoglycan/xylan/chitin deacetylase (PgdA/CDA1 family)